MDRFQGIHVLLRRFSFGPMGQFVGRRRRLSAVGDIVLVESLPATGLAGSVAISRAFECTRGDPESRSDQERARRRYDPSLNELQWTRTGHVPHHVGIRLFRLYILESVGLGSLSWSSRDTA